MNKMRKATNGRRENIPTTIVLRICKKFIRD
jgi:hypothetical protein